MTHYWLNLKVSTQILEAIALLWLFYACPFNNLVILQPTSYNLLLSGIVIACSLFSMLSKVSQFLLNG
jgi:hypothetical protein